MSITLYDLVGIDDRRFSPACWRTRMALAHKGLDCTTQPTPFTKIPTIADGQQKTVPVIDDNGTVVGDSWAIAEYLEKTYPDQPSLFGDDTSRALTLFAQNWTLSIVHRGLAPLILLDIYDHLLLEDHAYFRASREKMFGRTLEETQAGRDDQLKAFQDSLFPLRLTVRSQSFMGGDSPTYADYIVFGAFQWARVISDFKLFTDDDPVKAWFDRCLDLHDGLGRNALGYDQ